MDTAATDRRACCPYFIRGRGRHVECESLIPKSRAAVVFGSERNRIVWQRTVCERYEPEIVCPYAAALFEKDGR